MWFGVVTIFPEMFDALKGYGISRRAISNGLTQLNLYNPRNYALDKHATVDDRPYGGGSGMVMKVEPLLNAIAAAKKASNNLNNKNVLVINLSPQGKKIEQRDLRATMAQQDSIIFVCGRYEGIDERVCELAIDEEWSIGDFVLSGGELAAMAFIDAMIRLIPGALGDPNSCIEDSFGADKLLDYPHYTRPMVACGKRVPEVLLTGDHKAIADWRQQQRLLRTKTRREDLLGG